VLPESAHVGKKARALDFLKPDGVTLLAVKRGTTTQRRELEDCAGSGPEVLLAEIDPARVAAARARLPYLQDRAGLRLEAG
jgi:predicted amidohydrolase